jgi:starch-binding outer membrane protein, SusD/RagB family
MTTKLIKCICLAVLVGLSACGEDFLEQHNPNAIATSQFFQTEADVQLGVNGAYQSLRSANSIGEASHLFTDERSDDAGRNDNQSNAGEPFQFNDFSLLPSNTYLKNHWLALYESITRCNAVLAGIDQVAFQQEATRAQYQAEAKFLRALVYFHLVRKWGDVPLVTRPLGTAEEIQAVTFREKKEAVYAQIVADLEEAVNSPLPDRQTGANIGRVSKTAANALLGQVYLTMATTLDQANRTTYLNQAKQYLTAAYHKRTFGALKEIPYPEVFEVAKKSTNPELIFQIVHRQGDINYASSLAASFQAKGETINSLKPGSGSGGRATLDLVKEYEPGDLRKDFSVKYGNDPAVKDWFITKFRDTSPAAGANGYGGNDWILIRFADVILMLAEVHLYLGEETQAVQYLDMVRERALMPPYAVAKNDPAYSSRFPTLKAAILHERRVELAFEHHRWFDLLRFFTTEELVNYFHGKQQEDYGTARLANFSRKDRYFPIPFDENKLDPVRMYQNEGY